MEEPKLEVDGMVGVDVVGLSSRELDEIVQQIFYVALKRALEHF